MSHTRENLPLRGDCARIGDRLSAYLDGELSAAEAAEVAAHLAVCPDCARLCAALDGLRGDIAAARLEPPPALRGRVMARVRREARVRRLRRFTAIATAGVAAMFCFVVIGGALLRNQEMAFDAAPAEAGNYAKSALETEMAADCAENDVLYAATYSDAMTGAVADTTIEADLTLAATGLTAETSAVKSVSVPSPALTAPSNTPATTATVPVVLSVKLGENERDPARLINRSSIGGLSTDRPNEAAAEAAQTPLSARLSDAEARLAEEQVGTLCVLTRPEGMGIRYAVYDLISGAQLDLAAFLGGKEAPARFGATAETEFRPTAAGLWLRTATGEVVLPWTADAALAACVERYEMTKTPLCAIS